MKLFFSKLIKRFFPDEPIAVDERRASVRLKFRQEVSVKTPAETISGLTNDLTFTGLSLELPKALPEGTQVTLARDSLGPPFNGTVIWCKQTDSGKCLTGVECELDEDKLIDSWLEPALVQAGFEASFVGERRRLLRVPGQVECELIEADGTTHQGSMLDLSAGGALFQGKRELPAGTPVKFKTNPRGDSVQSLSGRAVVKSARSENDVWMLGLGFQEVDEESVRTNMQNMLHS